MIKGELKGTEISDNKKKMEMRKREKSENEHSNRVIVYKEKR